MTELAHDYLDLDSLFSAEELALRDRVRAFVAGADPPEHRRLVRGRPLPARDGQGAGRAGRARHAPDGYGCAGRSAVEYGLVAMELEAGDSGLRTFVSVQGSLAMSAHAQVRLRGAQAALAARDGRRRADRLLRAHRADRRQRPGEHAHHAPSATATSWVLDGAKRWIGLASIADVAIIWAKTERGHPRLRRAHRHPGVHRHPDRAEARRCGPRSSATSR